MDTVKQPCKNIDPTMPLEQQEINTESYCFMYLWDVEFIKECGCNLENFPPMKGVPYCTIFQLMECYILNSTNHFQITAKAVRQQKKCMPICKQIGLNPIMSAMELKSNILKTIVKNDSRFHDGDLSVVNFYYRTLSYEQEIEIDLYTPDTFISNIGGQIGLWMGCSILTVIQAITYFCKCCRVSLTSKEKWTKARTFSRVSRSTRGESVNRVAEEPMEPPFVALEGFVNAAPDPVLRRQIFHTLI